MKKLTKKQKIQAIDKVIAMYEKKETHIGNIHLKPYICIDLARTLKLNFIHEVFDSIPELILIKPENMKRGSEWFPIMNFTKRIKALKRLKEIIEQ